PKPGRIMRLRCRSRSVCTLLIHRRGTVTLAERAACHLPIVPAHSPCAGTQRGHLSIVTVMYILIYSSLFYYIPVYSLPQTPRPFPSDPMYRPSFQLASPRLKGSDQVAPVINTVFHQGVITFKLQFLTDIGAMGLHRFWPSAPPVTYR